MKVEHLSYVRCPSCQAELELGDTRWKSPGRVETGTLTCTGCSQEYPVLSCIPRFVRKDNYAKSFGLEWTRHARTQYDSESGVALSQRRFFEETGWPRQMHGELILEAGCGSGRFTEQAAGTGAMVISFDLSSAVEANHSSNGSRDNVLIVQADITRIPCPQAIFDKIFCLGVLQHTPDPREAFMSLTRFLRPGGILVVDVYKKTLLNHILQTKYWVRPLTRGRDPETLYAWVRRYVDIMWPLASVLRRIPKIGVPLNWRLLIGDYSNQGVPEARLKEWAYLDTFDMLSPQYDSPQTLDTVRRWFHEARLTDVDVRYGYNGIQGRGTRRAEASSK